MEEALDDLIADCLGVADNRRAVFAGVLLANTGLAGKTRSLRVLLETDEIGFKTEAVKKLFVRLEGTRDFRNLCAHVPPVGKDDDKGERVLHFVTYSQSGGEKVVRVDAESMAARISEAVDLANELRALRAVRMKAVAELAAEPSHDSTG